MKARAAKNKATMKKLKKGATEFSVASAAVDVAPDFLVFLVYVSFMNILSPRKYYFILIWERFELLIDVFSHEFHRCIWKIAVRRWSRTEDPSQ